MVPPLLLERIAAWLVLLAGPGVLATVLWSSVLASGRVRTLFRRLPLTGSTVGNYALVAMALSVPWVAGLLWAVYRLGAGGDAAQGGPFFAVAVLLAATYVVGLPLLAGVGLPRLGVDWDATGYGIRTWLVLVVASAWYAVIFAVPTFLFGIVVSLPF